MLSDSRVFRSAFTPTGWVEPQAVPSERRFLLTAPPFAAPADFWEPFLASCSEPVELFADPFAPERLEGIGARTAAWLISDHLHPRSSASAPFFDGIFDLHCTLPPLSSSDRRTGLQLFERQDLAIRRAKGSLSAARAYLEENLRISAAHIDTAAVQRRTETLLLQYLPDNRNSNRSENIKSAPMNGACTRFFSAMTSSGPMLCERYLRAQADTVILLDDEDGAAARMLLHFLLRACKDAPEKSIIGRCPFFWPDKIDHLLFPQHRLLVSTANRFHRLGASSLRIHCADEFMRPFSEKEKQQLHRNRRFAGRLFASAHSALREVCLLQAALASLCPFSMEKAPFVTNVRTNITAKNNAET